MNRKVPAWMLAVSEYSLPDYVYVLIDVNDQYTVGGKQTKLTHRLTPVRQIGEDAWGNPVVTFR